jgi:hypothetical protein
MVNTLAEVLPDAHAYFGASALDNQPEIAKDVCQVIALSAEIDVEIKLLIVHILGVDATAALAIFDSLNADHWREKALRALTKAVIPEAAPIVSA